MKEHNNREQEQEVDLVPVFVWIGNGIKSFFSGIVNFLRGIGHFLILTLLFIKKNIILLAALFIIGAGLGIYLDQKAKQVYSAEIRVKPYFESNAQLISNITSLNSLIEQENYEQLAQELNITSEQAATLNNFDIEPDVNDNMLLREYDAVTKNTDSTALVNYSFKGYKNSLRDVDYKYYLIKVTGNNRQVLEDVIIEASRINDNDAIKSQRLAGIENVDFKISYLKYQLTELDSLISSFQKAIKEPKNQDSGVRTNLYMGENGKNTSVTDLFEKKQDILAMLESARLDKRYYENTVNIVSKYVKIGAIEKPHYKIKLALVFFGLGLIIAFIPVLWKFLNNYENSLVKK